MEYKIEPNEITEISVFAKYFYSRDSLAIEPGATYRITCKNRQYWWDWFIRTSPSGYNNPLASWAGLRVKDAKCFSLCGVFDMNEDSVFEIGESTLTSSQQNHRSLHFFANDYRKAYWNNWGKIQIIIERIT